MYRIAVALGVAAALLVVVHAETPVENSVETQFQLDLQVPQAALQTLLPAGWTSNISAQGPAKDMNMRLIFVDRVTINGADGRPAGKGSNHVIWLTAPVKDGSGANVQLMLGGLTEDPSDAPGPFGVFLPATQHSVAKSSAVSGTTPVIDSQAWSFAAASGEHVDMSIKYERGVAARRPASDTKYYSAKTPTFFQISRQEQELDIVRNATTNPPDRVKEFALNAGGGSYAKLFDGTQKVLSWDNIIWINRSILVP
ncbi:MAG TPA: hypothetical protein VHZ73_12100 [Vicinamibacterales bacterium]|nr:hypothetical protein [Vicinamibacterales bacterium]